MAHLTCEFHSKEENQDEKTELNWIELNISESANANASTNQISATVTSWHQNHFKECFHLRFKCESYFIESGKNERFVSGIQLHTSTP